MSAELQIASNSNELAVLLIPINGKQLILPNVSVAEIIPYIEPDTVEDVPNWYLGTFEWRGINVPLVSFEAVNEDVFVGNSRNRRIIVLNGLQDSLRLPFCGFVAEGVPRLLRVMADELAVDNNSKAGIMELSTVLVNGERSSIPNVDLIQERILQLL